MDSHRGFQVAAWGGLANGGLSGDRECSSSRNRAFYAIDGDGSHTKREVEGGSLAAVLGFLVEDGKAAEDHFDVVGRRGDIEGGAGAADGDLQICNTKNSILLFVLI